MNTLIPNHPAFVHFPLGLLAGAFVFELLGLIFKRQSLHDAGRAALFLGALGALVSVATGLAGEELLGEPQPPLLHDLIERHETLAFITAALAVVLCMWRIAVRKRYRGSTRALFVLALAVLCGVVLYTGHIGGKMVYEHGAAVTVGRRAFGSPPLPAESLPAPTGSPAVEERRSPATSPAAGAAGSTEKPAAAPEGATTGK
ncbi:MAG: DUF2231 domain-containing protein [Candidatus Eisenbacteria bacterium]|nr:DUF2231 domain-containing protein [Candidatus Eisenbacteria bacterium]